MATQFDSSFYLKQYPDVKQAGIDPETHFKNFGAAEGRAPNAAMLPVADGFDEDEYLQANQDVADAVAAENKLESGYQHWVLYGANEGRTATYNNGTPAVEAVPSIEDIFNADEYLAANPDVKAAGVDPLQHFLNHGAAEGRAPNAEYREIAENFNEGAYRTANKDVDSAIDAGRIDNAYQHWVLYGQFEASRPEATLDDGRTVTEVLEGTGIITPTFRLTEALAAQEAGELPEEYELTDATADLGALKVAEVAAAQANAQDIVGGAANADELTLEASYSIEDSAASLVEADAAVLEAATSVTVTDSTITLEQASALEGVVAELPAVADSAENASGQSFDGAITVTGLDSTTEYNFSGLSNATVVISQNLDVADNVVFGGVNVDVQAGQQLTLTAAQATEIAEAGGSVTGSGSVVVADLDGAAIYDLSAIQAEATANVGTGNLRAGTDLGSVEVTVAAGETLTVTNFQSGEVYDFSNVELEDGTAAFEVAVDTDTVVAEGSQLGDLDVQLNGATLTLAAADASGATVSSAGAGKVVLTGAVTDGDFSDIDAAHDLDISGVTGTIDALPNSGTLTGDLTLTPAQASGETIAAANFVVTGFTANSIADFSELTATGTITAKITSNWNVAAGSDLNGATLDIAEGVTVTLPSAIAGADGVTTTGEGTLKLTGNAAIDMQHVDTSYDVSTYSGAASDLTNLPLNTEGKTFTLKPAQADGAKFTNDGNVVISGNVATGATVDLHNTTAPTLTFTDNSITLGTGATLTVDQKYVDGVTITGAGTLELTGAVTDAGIDLSGINVTTLDLSGATLHEDTVLPASVAANRKVILDDAQANGATIGGEGTVEIAGDITTDTDLSGITAELVFAGNTIEVKNGITLTLRADQAHEKAITDEGSGAVVITNLDGEAAYDFANVAAASATISADTTLDANTNLGDVQVQVGDGVTLTLAVGVADAADIVNAQDADGNELDGTVKVTGNLDGEDLTTLNVATLDLRELTTDAAAFSLGALVADEVLLTVAQADGATVTGTASVVVDGALTLDGDNVVEQDFSKVATLDLRQATIPADAEFEPAAKQTVIVTQAQLANFATLGNVGGSGNTGDADTVYRITDVGATPAVDLSAITTSGAIELTVSDDNVTLPAITAPTSVKAGGIEVTFEGEGAALAAGFNFTNTSLVVAEGASLELAGSQAVALTTATGTATGAGTVKVSGDLGATDISNIAPATGTVDLTEATNASATKGDWPFDGDVPADATLQLSATLAGGAELAGTGRVEITGDLAGKDLSSITTSIVDLSGAENAPAQYPFGVADGGDPTATPTPGVPIELSTGETLILAPAAADGKFFVDATATSGNLVINGEWETGNLDLINVGANLDITDLTVTGGSVRLPGADGLVDASLAEGQTLTANASEIDGKAVTTNAGELAITLDDADAYDLSGVNATGGTAQATFLRDTDGTALEGELTLANGTKLGVVNVLVGNDQTLNLSAATASGATITGTNATGAGGVDDNASQVVIDGLAADTDLSGITAGDRLVNVTEDVTLSTDADLNGVTVNVPEGVTLTGPAAELDGVTVNGAGSVVVTGYTNETLNGNADLTIKGLAAGANFSSVDVDYLVDDETVARNVTVEVANNVTFTGTLKAGVTLEIADGRTVTTTAAKLDDTANVVGDGSVEITDDASGVDLSKIATDLTLSSATNVTASTPITFPTLSADQTLTGTAAQLNGAVIAGEGTVAVTALNSTAAADLSDITATTVTAEVDGDVTFTGDLGNAVVTVTEGHTLTADAAVLDGATIEGEGSVTVTGLNTVDSADLSGIQMTGDGQLTVEVAIDTDLSNHTGLDTVDAYSVAGDAFLFLSADQASGRVLEGNNAASNIIVSGTVENGDFSSIEGTVNVDLTEVDGNVTLPETLAANQTLTVTAAQVAGKAMVVAGTLEIVDLHETPDADLSALEVDGGTINAAFDLSDYDVSGVNFTAQVPSVVNVVVGEGAQLIAEPATIDGMTISGDGSVVATAGTLADANFDAISANLDVGDVELTGTPQLPNGGQLTGGQILRIDGDYITGVSIDQPTATVIPVGALTDANFIGIQASLNLTEVALSGNTLLAGRVDADTVARLVDDQVLTLTGEQASELLDGNTVDQAVAKDGTSDGVLAIVGNVADLDLRDVSADLDLSGAQLGDTTQLPGATNIYDAVLGANQTLTLNADDVAGLVIDNGILEVTGELTADLNLISANYADTTVNVDTVNVADGVTFTLTANQANNGTFNGEGSVDVLEDDGNTTTETYSVDLGEAVKATIEFSDLEDVWEITGANQDDVLDFSLIAASEDNGLSSTNFQQYVKGAAIDAGFLAIATDLVDGNAGTDTDAAAFFATNGTGGLGRELNDDLAANSKMIFALSDSVEVNGGSQLWYWDDTTTVGGGTPGDGIVQSDELTNIGTLTDINGAELAGLTADNVDLIA